MQKLPFYWVSPRLVTELDTLLSYNSLQGGLQDPISTDEKSKPRDNEFFMQSTQSWIPMHAGLFPPIRLLRGDFKSTLRLKPPLPFGEAVGQECRALRTWMLFL